jgi:hypothetical protein
MGGAILLDPDLGTAFFVSPHGTAEPGYRKYFNSRSSGLEGPVAAIYTAKFA